MEGDATRLSIVRYMLSISTHALRMEGDHGLRELLDIND